MIYQQKSNPVGISSSHPTPLNLRHLTLVTQRNVGNMSSRFSSSRSKQTGLIKGILLRLHVDAFKVHCIKTWSFPVLVYCRALRVLTAPLNCTEREQPDTRDGGCRTLMDR